MAQARTMTNKLKTNAKNQKENSDGSARDHLRQNESERTGRRRIRMAPARAILDKLKANEEGRRRIRMTRARGILDKLKANEQAKQNSDGSGPLHAPTWDLFRPFATHSNAEPSSH